MNSARSHIDITRCRFPDSEIDGSTPVYGSPSLIAVLPRPSSPLGAKASPECSYKLDHRNVCLLDLSVSKSAGRWSSHHSGHSSGLVSNGSLSPSQLTLVCLSPHDRFVVQRLLLDFSRCSTINQYLWLRAPRTGGLWSSFRASHFVHLFNCHRTSNISAGRSGPRKTWTFDPTLIKRVL
jgi:hypothetical protein